ncbi:hypothetical protein, partial [Microvirga sp. P5_D2]
HPRWGKANVKALLTFNVDGARFRALRSGDRVAVFDAENRLLISTTSFTSELGPFFAKLLDFKLVLSNRKGAPETPPPAYAFLPFYVDQDAGWAKPLSSFDRLQQYANFKKFLIEFHSGIRPNRYYELIADKKKLEIEKRELEHDHRVVQKAVARLGLEPSFDGIELSYASHEDAIDGFLVRLKVLREIRQARALELSDILDLRTTLNEQASIVQASVNELAMDAEWASDDARDEIPCPTCGTRHQNNFANRFSILRDREECLEFLSNTNRKVRGLSRRVEELQETIRSTDKTVSEIQEILERQHGDVTLKDVIESEGRRAAFDVFASQLRDLQGAIGNKIAAASSINDEIKKLNDPAIKRKVENYYASLMGKYLRSLNFLDPDNDAITKITGKIVETGSEHPRLLLAYILSLSDTIHRFTTSFTAPLVIDSPVQQEQDRTNAPAIVKLVTSKRPNGGQTIIGTISLHGIELTDAKKIVFEEKKSALQAAEYSNVYGRMRTLMQSM